MAVRLSEIVGADERFGFVVRFLRVKLLPELVEIVVKELFGIPEAVRNFKGYCIQWSGGGESVEIVGNRIRYRQVNCYRCKKTYGKVLWKIDNYGFSDSVNYICCIWEKQSSAEQIAKFEKLLISKF